MKASYFINLLQNPNIEDCLLFGEHSDPERESMA